LGGNGLRDDGLQSVVSSNFLSNASHLIKLDLRYNDITAKGMTTLCEALQTTSIELLYLEGNQIQDEGVQALADLLVQKTKIRELYLGANQISSNGAKALAQSLYQNKLVSKVYLEGNNIGLEGANAFSTVLEDLKGDTALKNLYVDNNNIGKDGSKRLANALNSSTVIDDPIF
jgi:Ran GTPase-activating protein (RanGAP) involved in mRNA processing and transport